MTAVDDAYEKVTTQFSVLKTAVEDYFAAKQAYDRARHDDECTDPLCDERTNYGALGPESLSTFVVLAELTAVTENGTMTHTSRCFQGSAMACLGLITEAKTVMVLQGHG
jgi:hypothetical protein